MKNAQTKAKELIDKFIPLVDFDKQGLAEPNAKKCATICCDEAISSLRIVIETLNEQFFFYEKVKEEINK